MIRVQLTRAGRSYDVTGLLVSWTWSGDKSAISRQLEGEIVRIEESGLPVPEIGDAVTLDEDGTRLFVGVVLKRSAGSEDQTMSFAAFDHGYYLHRNDATRKFTGATAEAITRMVCGELEIPVAALASTGIQLRRKFTGVKLNQLIATVWYLAAEKTGKSYAIRYTPEGLVVKERGVSAQSLVLQGGSNLMDAATTEDATKMVNRVAIYDSSGNLLRRTGDTQAQKLYGVMEEHLTQSGQRAADADSSARKTLEDGKLQRTVTVNVLGDTRLITGETVTVREPKTGLTGIFWIDADIHTWKNKAHYAKLTLNCRNVMMAATAGSELT